MRWPPSRQTDVFIAGCPRVSARRKNGVLRIRSLACFFALAGCSHGTVGGLPVTIDPADTSSVTRRVAQPSGVERSGDLRPFNVVYDFKGFPDGAFPLAGLTDVDGVFYGTTSQGGSANASGDGTVFKITPGGKETVVYSFIAGADGQFPQAGLIAAGGLLYGTTPNGGEPAGSGTVFSVSPTGSEKVLYSFAAGADGAGPQAGLLDLNGTFYGTTATGGGGNCADGLGCGTVFKIAPSGAETVLHRFAGGSVDGQLPSAALVDAGGTLYGTTFFGGGSGCNFRGCGTVFKITPSGEFAIVYSFMGGSDGANPSAGMVSVDGTLYGTTSEGGANDDGTVFRVTPRRCRDRASSFQGRRGRSRSGSGPRFC